MSSENPRDRLLLPLLIPIVALMVIAAFAIGLAKILLSVSAEAATFIALSVGIAVLLVGSQIARFRKGSAGPVVLMFASFAGVAIFAGGTMLALGRGYVPEHEEGPEVERAEVSIVAEGLKFVPTDVPVPADEPLAIDFDNKDAGTQHNIEIFDGEADSDPVLFDGEIITGPAQVTYDVEPLKAGSYLFICKVHPTMTGKLDAGEGGGGSSGGEPVTIAQSAKGLKFAESDLKAPAESPITIDFDNQDTGIQHNVRVFEGEDAEGTPVFDGEILTGPKKAAYDVGPLAAGAYFFDCVVHPTMTGRLTIEGAGKKEGGGKQEPSKEPDEPPGGGEPPVKPPDGSGGAGAPVSVREAAHDLQFVEGQLQAPAEAPLTIDFDNQDSGVPHNVRVFEGDGADGTPLFDGEVITGPATAAYDVGPLAAGSYFFDCKIHPTMTGTLKVG
ncbi:MAG: cupredoxin domain-containing protein [Actinomycetota bacterium]